MDPLGLDDGELEDEYEEPPERKRKNPGPPKRKGGGRPSDAPPGTRRIDDDPRVPNVHELKEKIPLAGIGAQTDIWITPDGDVLVTGPDGKKIEAGKLSEIMQRECPIYLPIPPGAKPVQPIAKPAQPKPEIPPMLGFPVIDDNPWWPFPDPTDYDFPSFSWPGGNSDGIFPITTRGPVLRTPGVRMPTIRVPIAGGIGGIF